MSIQDQLTAALVEAKRADDNIVICFDIDKSFTNEKILLLSQGLDRQQIDTAKFHAVIQTRKG